MRHSLITALEAIREVSARNARFTAIHNVYVVESQTLWGQRLSGKGSLLVFLVASDSFGATLNSDFQNFRHWRYILEHEHFTPPTKPFEGDLKDTLDKLQEKYLMVPYKTDVQVYGEYNHWATRAETKAHGAADCKGIAEAELFDLLEMGVPDQDVEIIVARDAGLGYCMQSLARETGCWIYEHLA